MPRTIKPLVVHDYSPPECETCGGVTEPLHVLDEGEDTSLALTNAGYCLSCSTIIVDGKGAVLYILAHI